MNLLFNTVYYAAHVPRAHYRVPEALAVVDHISLFTEEELKGYRTNSDGGNLIGKESGDLSEYITQSSAPEGRNYFFVYKKDSKKLFYTISGNGDIQEVEDLNSKTLDIHPLSEVEKREAYDRIQTFITPIVERQSKPIVNLQWIYNALNYIWFNSEPYQAS